MSLFTFDENTLTRLIRLVSIFFIGSIQKQRRKKKRNEHAASSPTTTTPFHFIKIFLQTNRPGGYNCLCLCISGIEFTLTDHKLCVCELGHILLGL